MSNVKYTPKKTANSHQTFGVEKMLKKTHLNFDDQGLGKTKQAYDTAGNLISKKVINLAIFITKASLVENMLREIQDDAQQLTALSISGNLKARLESYKYISGNAIVLSYDTLIRDISELTNLAQVNSCALFFDESHYIKNPKSKRAISALDLSAFSDHVYCFSGTPIPNKTDDIYTQLCATGLIKDMSLNDFKARYRTAEELNELLQDKYIRRLKTEVKELSLPNKKHIQIEVPLSAPEFELYNSLESDFVKYLETSGQNSKIPPIKNVLTKLLRMNQFLSNPGLLVDEYTGARSKLEACINLTNEIIKKNEKVIIWTSFRENTVFLGKALKKHAPLILAGDTSSKRKAEIAHLFQNSDDYKVIIAIPAAAREGFTLTAANHAIYLDRSYSSLDWLQSQDRIHRISQKKECFIYTLETPGSIDETITAILNQKQDQMTTSLGDPSRNTPDTKNLSSLIEGIKSRVQSKSVKKK